ncbi:acetamidase/formamidase family protein [Methylobacterium sp. NMS14P]|uniref:acetamidase/formamidase family protein n=1 Tax=Methylobacterium sp. NMS14P TaxID=2894310 RepID=UPI00235897B1|nr:acetamidase/formamidase family protein [Methylobacterium sp. NMS14P]WCS24113.1 acetamidase/formamidase family protein [Methylobacterium sp. NMS14P]
MPRHHEIPAVPETMVLGTFDAARPPVLRVASGDTVTLHAHPAGGRATLHPDPARVPADLLHALDTLPRGLGPHFMTGPVHVEGAEPGDMLQVDILDLRFRLDWGFVSILPLLGTLPDEFTDYETVHADIDAARGICRLPWGTELPLAPFFGILGTAPPAAWGPVGSAVPRAFGGNMDNKELTVGTTLYLPVFNAGGGFYAGDGHGVQGDGEVCVTALETGLTGTVRLTVREDLREARPFAETPTDLMSIGLHESLDEAMRQAVRGMIRLVCDRTPLTRNQAYMLCSLAGNLRITQTVDGNKGVHMLLPKAALATA